MVSPKTHFLTVVMLLVSLLAIGLVVEAIRTTRRHQVTAEEVLADYAALGAQGSGGRLATVIAPWFYQILGTVRESPRVTLTTLPSRLSGTAAELAGQVEWAGRLDWRSGAIVTGAGTAPGPALLDSMRATNNRLGDGAYLGTARHADAYLVFSPLREGSDPVAFLLSAAAVEAKLQELANEVMILPPAIYPVDSLDRGLGIELHAGGRVIARRGFADSTRFIGHHDMGPMFGNLAVRVRIAEDLAPALVIGGVPRSRVPLLAGVLFLTLLLAGAAVVQAQQERQLVRLREDVVAGASHELRTPLAQIRLFAETLRLGRVRTEDERERALVIIEREARRLEHLVDNLLHTARFERGGIQLAREHLDVAALTRQIVDEFAPLAGKGGVRMEVSGDHSAMASVDAAAWRQVVMNLLDNAVKYGGRGSVVRVEVCSPPGRVVLTMSDEGPGVPPSDRDKVWQRFWRGGAAVSSGAAGSGLGLATVRDLVALHGGRCAVVESRDTGATFQLDLPR